jgi:hypothetical protein
MQTGNSKILVEVSGVYLPKGTQIIIEHKKAPPFPYRIDWKENEYPEPGFTIPNWEDEEYLEEESRVILSKEIWEIHLKAIGNGIGTTGNAVDYMLECVGLGDVLDGWEEYISSILHETREKHLSESMKPNSGQEIFRVITLWEYRWWFSNYDNEYDEEHEILGVLDMDNLTIKEKQE